mgnify:CR=1 FL=1
MKKLLIAGLSGRTGRYFLNEINNKKLNDYEIYATVRNTDTVLDGNINKVIIDLDDFNKLNEFLVGFDTVFHIVNIKKSVNVVKAAINNNVRWVILVHTTGIYSKFKSASQEYIEIEKQIEDLIKDTNTKITILRPTMIYGSLDDQNMSFFIKMVNKLKIFPIVNNGKYYLQPVHQEDLGKAYYSVLINEDKTIGNNYNLSGKDKLYLIDILKTISNKLNKKTIFISIPFSIAYFGGWCVYLLSFTKIDLREKIQRLVEPRAYDHDDAIKDFNYSPIPFEEGIGREIDLFKAK